MFLSEEEAAKAESAEMPPSQVGGCIFKWRPISSGDAATSGDATTSGDAAATSGAAASSGDAATSGDAAATSGARAIRLGHVLAPRAASGLALRSCRRWR